MQLIRFFLLCATLLFVTGSAAAGSFFEQMIDPQDGKLDISQMLASKTGFLPVPLIISDPAVGYGAGQSACIFYHFV